MSNKAHCIHKQSKQRRKHINKTLCIIYLHLKLFIYICKYNNITPPGLMRRMAGWLWYNKITPPGLAQARRADMIVAE